MLGRHVIALRPRRMHAAAPVHCAPCVRQLHPRRRHTPGARRAPETQAAAAGAPGPPGAGARVSELLGGTSVFVVGDNASANQEVATALAARLGCVYAGA